MFTIYGGKTEFNQWEQGHRVTEPKLAVGDKVRFWNASGETHPMIAYQHEGVIVADVPNDLLQHYSPILVELCGNPECLTRFIVNAQDKPADYVFVDNTHCEPAPSGPSSGGLTELPEGYPYKEKSETVLVEETAVEMSAVGETGLCQGSLVTDLHWTDGENYILKLDGESYECTVKNLAGTMYIGNLWYMLKALGTSDEEIAQTGIENTGERFYIYLNNDYSNETVEFVITLGDVVETVTFGLSQKSETIQPMAEEFMPLLTSPNGTKYKLTVSDDGTLSAVAVS